jgi:hypothetical protein
LKKLGNLGFQHYTGLRVLTQMRGHPIWLDPCSGRYRAAASGYLLCLAANLIRLGCEAPNGIILGGLAGISVPQFGIGLAAPKNHVAEFPGL